MTSFKGELDLDGNTGPDSPFCISNDDVYLRFREKKLNNFDKRSQVLRVPVKNLNSLTHQEKQDIINNCQRFNMAFYSTEKAITKKHLTEFALQFGLSSLDANPLSDDDGISSIQVSDISDTKEFIPYTNKSIQWHTDGYYNDAGHMVRSVILHCEMQAESGGENEFFDHEILYILIRDKNPAYVKALMETDAMSIPPSVGADGTVIRPERIGPVFSISKEGDLHMRYTARTKSISWKRDAVLEEALSFMTSLLASDSEYKVKARLSPGEGIICNNVLHNRNSFIDGKKNRRLVFRARYFERIAS